MSAKIVKFMVIVSTGRWTTPYKKITVEAIRHNDKWYCTTSDEKPGHPLRYDWWKFAEEAKSAHNKSIFYFYD